jgi:hypothetical protein
MHAAGRKTGRNPFGHRGSAPARRNLLGPETFARSRRHPSEGRRKPDGIKEDIMNLASRIALAAVLASAVAAPALADEWQYRGGPKGPQSVSGPSYGQDDSSAYGGSAPYAGAYGGAYAYSAPSYRVYARSYRGDEAAIYGGRPLYRCVGPAFSSDC